MFMWSLELCYLTRGGTEALTCRLAVMVLSAATNLESSYVRAKRKRVHRVSHGVFLETSKSVLVSFLKEDRHRSKPS